MKHMLSIPPTDTRLCSFLFFPGKESLNPLFSRFSGIPKSLMCSTNFKQGTYLFGKNQATTQMSPLQELVLGKACCHMCTAWLLRPHSDSVHVGICRFVSLMLWIYVTGCASINQCLHVLFSFPEAVAGAHADVGCRMVFQLYL